MYSERVRHVLAPGWYGSGDAHWQSHWQRALPNISRVEQQDWTTPLHAGWTVELDAEIRRQPGSVVLVAYSPGCVTTALWVAQAERRARDQVRGALLVTPADVEHESCAEALRNFAPINRESLPFPSVLVGFDNDQACSLQRAMHPARTWGAETVILLEVGHINVKSGHGAWEVGYRHLLRLQYLIDSQARRHA